MKRHWETDELVEHWTLLPRERAHAFGRPPGIDAAYLQPRHAL